MEPLPRRNVSPESAKQKETERKQKQEQKAQRENEKLQHKKQLQEEKEQKKAEKFLKRTDAYIPQYDALFTQEESANAKRKRGGNGFLKKFFRLNWKMIFLSCLFFTIKSIPSWAIPLVSANLIDLAEKAISLGGITDAIWNSIGWNVLFLIIVIVQNPFSYSLEQHFSSTLRRTTSAGVRSAVVRKLQGLSITYHKDMETGKIQSKFIKDTESVDSLISVLVDQLIPGFIAVIVSATIAVNRSGTVALFFLLVVPINVLASRILWTGIAKRSRDFRRKYETVSSHMNTMLEMLPVTKAHGLEQREFSGMHREIATLSGSGYALDKTNCWFASTLWVVSATTNAGCLLFCIYLAVAGKISIGSVLLFQSLFSTLSANVIGLVHCVPAITHGLEAVTSIGEIMSSTDMEYSLGKNNATTVRGDVEFEHVTYTYPGMEEPVISDFSLKVNAGECIAVVGSSGSGKSTLMNVIIGFLTPEKGCIKIDGVPLTDLNLTEYRHHISVVPQNSILFPGSIRENITYGMDGYTEEDLNRVVEAANISEFIAELPDGLNTSVGEHGGKLSGGQKQRVTIARALIRNPSLLILDEATSALDNVSEYHVQQAISKAVKGRTTFIVAHRLSTIRDADRIVVMEGGKIAETGSYEELMEKKGKFYELKCLNDATNKQAEAALNNTF